MDWTDLLGTDSSEELVERLKRRFEERRSSLAGEPPTTIDQRTGAPRGAEPRPEPGAPASFGERARAHFAALEAEQHERARSTRELLDALRAERAAELGTAPPQRLLELRAEPGAVAGGAFAVENASAVAVAMAFEVVAVRDGAGVSRTAPPIEFEPATPQLAPRESRRVRVRIELADGPLEPGARLELQVRAYANGRHALTLWIDVQLDARIYE